jgi:hypothetical protein
VRSNKVRGLYRGNNDSNKGYLPRTNTEKDEKGDFVSDCHSNLARWSNHFTQLLNEHSSNDVRQTELLKSGGRTICSEIHTLFNSVWNKEDLSEEWESIIVPIY